jgi:hypothetical protein
MKNKSKSIGIVSAFLLTVWATASAATPQSSGCPNVRASLVDARTEGMGDSERCGLGVSLFGWGVGLFGPRCPDKKATYPAHGECSGARNDGTRCVKQGDLKVTLEECECSVAGIFGTGLSLPHCSCSPSSADGGTVENFVTQNCGPDA